ncbi:2Fe-2S iron-sulfur cluster binding domain-containing protein [Streptomyces parvulus]|nr:2Fe-2S iron-sulfur cluster binding domain-containing protein [Streptomyces parvulus]
MHSCTEGTCGTCETEVVEGEPDHRDSLLTEEGSGPPADGSPRGGGGRGGGVRRGSRRTSVHRVKPAPRVTWGLDHDPALGGAPARVGWCSGRTAPSCSTASAPTAADPVRQALAVGGLHDRSWAMSRRTAWRTGSRPWRSRVAAKCASIGRHQLDSCSRGRGRVRVEQHEPEEVVGRHGRRVRSDAPEECPEGAVGQHHVPAVVDDEGGEGDGLQERRVVLEIRLDLGGRGSGRGAGRCPPA